MLSIIIGTMIVLLLLGFPMMVPLLIASLMLLFLVLDMGNVGLLMGQMISGVQSWALAAVPLFIFAADLMTRGHTANRLLDLVQTFGIPSETMQQLEKPEEEWLPNGARTNRKGASELERTPSAVALWSTGGSRHR